MKNLEAEFDKLKVKYWPTMEANFPIYEPLQLNEKQENAIFKFIRTREKRLVEEMIRGLGKDFGGNYSYGWNQKRKEIINIARKYKIL